MLYGFLMRTTLDLDEDVLLAVKEMAASQRTSIGKVLSDLARLSLRSSDTAPANRSGAPLLPKRPGERPVSKKLVNRLRDQE
jgi:hypothetical protein